MNRLAVAAASFAVFLLVDVHAQMGSLDKADLSADSKLGLEGLWRLTESAEQAMASEDYDAAAQLFATLLESSGFAELDMDRRHLILSSAAELASVRADFEQAHALYRRSSMLARADSDDWMGRLNAAWFVGDHDDAVESLVRIAEHWPGELQYVSEWAVDALLVHARSHRADAERALLEALFDSGWQTDLGEEPSELWMRLIELLAAAESIDRALIVSSRLRDPLAIVAMLSDRRYARIVAAAPEWFDVQETIDAGIIEARLAVEANPHLLAPSIALCEALLGAGRADDALLVIDTHLARATLRTVTGKALEDALAETVRALTVKATALIALERWEAAGETLALAAKQALPQHRSDDYYAVAMLQARLGLSRAATATLQKVPAHDDDPQAELIRFIVAQSQHDAAAADAALEALLETDSGATAQAQRALLIAGRTEAAAALLIRRLNDPLQRTPALLEIQGMREQRWPEAALDWQAPAARLLARDDVRRSVAESGGIVADYALYRWN